MCPFEFSRPKTLAEALELLERGVPLAGGTALTPRRGEKPAVIDLRELGLDNLEIQASTILIGAGLNLQKMVDAVHILPVALREVCIQRSGLESAKYGDAWWDDHVQRRAVSVANRFAGIGAKAVAEIPMDGVAPAVGNVVMDACGANVVEAPVTPERVWRALKDRMDLA